MIQTSYVCLTAYRWFAIALLMIMTGCADIAYYTQAVSGQWQMLRLREPVVDILANPDTELRLRHRLQLAESMREFASKDLALPENESYRSYADLERSHVVYNVIATEALSLEPYQWCFPLIGCVSYRGYFEQAAAKQLADDLRSRGFDVYVAGVPAYSTLGYFDDPLLNTFIYWDTGRIAELVFHELSHQQLYIADDTTFNESFATFVGELGAERWLDCYGNVEERARYASFRRRRDEFLALVLSAKEELNALYSSAQSDAVKFDGKQKFFNTLRNRYEILKNRDWDGFSGYDEWFQNLNNAKLAALATYTHYVPAFAVIFANSDRDFSRFYGEVASIAELPQTQRAQRLDTLLAEQRLSAVPLYENCCSDSCVTSSRRNNSA